MRRYAVLLFALLAMLFGPLAGAGQAAEGLSVTSVKYVSGKSVEVTGTVSCPAGSTYYWGDISVYQKTGRLQTTGWGWVSGTCTGAPQTVTTVLDNYSPVAFRRGTAELSYDLYASGECYVDEWGYEYCDTVGLAAGTTRVKIR